MEAPLIENVQPRLLWDARPVTVSASSVGSEGTRVQNLYNSRLCYWRGLGTRLRSLVIALIVGIRFSLI